VLGGSNRAWAKQLTIPPGATVAADRAKVVIILAAPADAHLE
jgi:hypothetical protein